MKKLILSLLFASTASIVIAQAPQAINYQAVARDASNSPIVSTTIGVRFQIFQGGTSGTLVYHETHTPITNQVGLFNLAIGRGTVQFGVFSGIDWFNSPFFLEVAIDPAGGTAYQVVGNSELLSVPYALFAEGAQMISDGDGDTWIDPDPGNNDMDEIHMNLGGTPGVIQPGTTDQALVLRKNAGKNTMLELFDPSGGDNTFVGEMAGEKNTYIPAIGTNPTKGELNTAFGNNALRDNTTGKENTAVGAYALPNNTAGKSNTAVGIVALRDNLTGDHNTAMGSGALQSNQGGHANTAIGNNTLTGNKEGKWNTALGSEALRNNTTLPIGGSNVSGTGNTATGKYAMFNNTIGSDNSATGAHALLSNTTGDKNTAIGVSALSKNTGGTLNTAIGYAADVDATQPNLTNATAIGANAIVTTSDAMILGKDVNVGIGLSGDLIGPANRLEINAAQPDASGLRFRKLNSGSPAGTPSPAKALSVDAKGDVILIDLTSLAGGNGTDWHFLGGNAYTSLAYLGTNDTWPGTPAPLKFKVNANHSGIIDPNGQVFLGFQAGLGNTLQTNTGIGYQALKANGSTGAENTAMGYQALTNNGPNATGDQAKFNTAIGSKSLFTNTVGKSNTAIGYEALYSTLNNDNNTAVGSGALRENVNGAANTATGVNAMHDNMGGSYNTAYGTFAMTKNQGGSLNTAIGVGALDQNVNGSNNTAIGVNSLEKAAGSYNTATGFQALRNNKADGNTANGVNALELNTNGKGNVAVGFSALAGNTLASNNTAVGLNALKSNSISFESGDSNTATGANAMEKNNFGSNNSAYGANALKDNISGTENTALGYNALLNTNGLDGHNNTAIGSYADVKSLDLTTVVYNSTAVGAGAVADLPNQIRLGNSLVETVLPGSGCKVTLGNGKYRWKEVWACEGMIQTSDYRLKSNILNTPYGLDEVMHLRPVQYVWKSKPADPPMVGFIAQEVEKIIPESVVAPKNENEFYAMKYDALIPVLTKAIQEQQEQIEILKLKTAELKELKESNLNLQSQITALQSQFQIQNAPK